MTGNINHRGQMLLDAAKHLESAIELLDGADAPGEIAAKADLALQQLKDVICAPSVAKPAGSINDRRKARTS